MKNIIKNNNEELKFYSENGFELVYPFVSEKNTTQKALKNDIADDFNFVIQIGGDFILVRKTKPKLTNYQRLMKLIFSNTSGFKKHLPILVMDFDGRILYINPIALQQYNSKLVSGNYYLSENSFRPSFGLFKLYSELTEKKTFTWSENGFVGNTLIQLVFTATINKKNICVLIGTVHPHANLLTPIDTHCDVEVRELHHRVKNNLQILNSMLDLKLNIEHPTNVSEIVNYVRSRLFTISLLHDELYRSYLENKVEIKRYIADITQLYKSLYIDIDFEHKINISPTLYFSPAEAFTLGLLYNELITNTLKHNHSDGKCKLLKSSIEIESENTKTHTKNTFIYIDNGQGLSEEAYKNDSFGIKIIGLLARKLKGNIETKKENGFEIIITWFSPSKK